MKALAAATTGLAAYDAKQQIVKGQGVTANGKDHQIPTGQMNPDGTPEYRDASAAEQVGGVNLVISIGASKSSSKTTQTSDNAAVSTLSAGRDITIVATGAGKESDITLQGAQIDATRNLTLSAEDEIKLRAAANTADQKSSNKNSSGSIGISFGSDGLLLNLSASGGRGKADGTDLVHTNTHVTAGETLTLQSGGDTTLKGAVARGERVVADIGGDLLIESLQDTSRYESKQKSLGGSLSIGYGRMSGSVSASGSKVKSDYASVTEQTGIRAGDGGFDITVQGNTDLKGAVIASSDKAIEGQKNRLTTATLTTSDIDNWAEASASSSGLSVSSDMFSQGKYGMFKGGLTNALNNAKESEDNSGETRSAISEGIITLTDEDKQRQRTGQGAEQTLASLNRDVASAHTAAEKIDAEAMEKTVEAERTIKQEAAKVALLFTDEAYRKLFIEKHPVYEVLTDDEGNTLFDEKTKAPLLRELSEEEIHDLKPGADGKISIAPNGIFNDAVRAGGYADQHSTTPGPKYVMYFPESDNVISELMVAGYQKFLENDFWGLSNSTAQVKGIMKQYGNEGLHVDGHSRGGMTLGNAMESLARDPESYGLLGNTTLKLVGPAYGAEDAASLLDWLSGGRQTSVQLQNHADDFVGVLLGGNPATHDQRPPESNKLKEWWRIFGEAPTVHSCYGTGAISENCKPNYGEPKTINVNSGYQNRR